MAGTFRADFARIIALARAKLTEVKVEAWSDRPLVYPAVRPVAFIYRGAFGPRSAAITRSNCAISATYGETPSHVSLLVYGKETITVRALNSSHRHEPS